MDITDSYIFADPSKSQIIEKEREKSRFALTSSKWSIDAIFESKQLALFYLLSPILICVIIDFQSS